jgi:CHAT domain-containing protein/tetratricopeptide (TPR) repeat protein
VGDWRAEKALRGFAKRTGGLIVGVAVFFGSTAARSAITPADVYRSIAKHLEEGHPDSAAALVEPALAAALDAYSGDSLAVAAYADSLGRRFINAYDYTTGVMLLERGVALREAVLPKNDPALAGPLEQLSTAYYIAGRLADAVAPQERALAIKAASLGADDPSVAFSRYDLALVFYRLTRYSDAERELRAALATYELKRDQEPLPVAEIERVLGEVCRELNRYEEAEQLISDALALSRGALPERDPELVVFLNSLAGFYKDQARYDESELLLEEALDIRTRAGLEDELATPTLNLAEVYRLQGRYDDAIPLYRRALAIARKTMPPLEVAEFHNQLAAVYAEAGRAGDAEAQYRTALAEVDSSEHASPQVVAQFKNDLGVLLAREGRRDEAEALLEQAIALRKDVFGANHPLVAVSLTELACTKAGLLGAAPSERVRAPGDDQAALLLDRALAILDSTDAEPEARIDAGVARAQLFYRAGRVDRAAESMARSLDVVESLRPHRGGGGAERIEFIRRYVDAYDRMTAWQVELNDAPSALSYSERRRARVLVDRLTGSSAVTTEPLSRDALERLREEKRDLETQLGACEEKRRALRAQPRLSKGQREELARVEANCDRLVENIQRTSDRILRLENTGSESLASDASTWSLATLQLAKDEMLLVYHIGTESSFLFVVEGGSKAVGVHTLHAGPGVATVLGIRGGSLRRETLARLFTGEDAAGKTVGLGLLRQLSSPMEASAANSVTARAQQSLQERLRALFAVLVPAPVWEATRLAREVTVIPDGPLSAFPLEALVTAKKDANDVMFWLDDGPPVCYAPSLAALDVLRDGVREAANGSAVLSVCNPRYSSEAQENTNGRVTRAEYVERGGSLAPLPGTARETEAVVAAFGKQRVTVLCGDAATEAAVRREVGNKQIVHLATHGLVSQRRSDLLAALAFTPGTSPRRDLRDDGFLHLFEIYDLSVAAELVVLSACESSAGSYALGEGVMALSRGFLSAGARRVVATQWKVDDAATASLIGDFLSRVARSASGLEGVDYAVALRDAKRAIRARSEWSQPFFWAAFVISGAP